jgi:hypothetical protein
MKERQEKKAISLMHCRDLASSEIIDGYDRFGNCQIYEIDGDDDGQYAEINEVKKVVGAERFRKLACEVVTHYVDYSHVKKIFLHH